MEPDGDSTPIWSTPPTPFVPVRRHRRLSSFVNPVTLTIALSVLLIFIIFLLLPSTLSRNNQVLKPNSSVKKSWNSINIFFVLFAVLCGVFARRNDETTSSYGAEAVPINAYGIVNSGRRSVSGADWFESPDRKAYDEMSDYMNPGGNRLRRSSSSYPDHRQESLWGSDGAKFKFFDDFEVDFHHPPVNFHRHVRQSHEMEKDVVAETSVREIPVDKFELKNSVPLSPTQPVSQVPQPPPPPPPPMKRRRSVHSVAKQYNVERGAREAEFNENRSSSVPPPSKTLLQPQPPELKFHPLAERREKFPRKKKGTTKELATVIVSLYQATQGKWKKKGKSTDVFESVAQNSSLLTELAPSSTPSVSPPPPPPPPSKKVLQNFFKKSSKSKHVHSVSTANPPPPPPPPPPSSIFNSIFSTGSKNKRFQLTSASSKSPPPPPPPPLPPPPSTKLNSLFKNGTRSQRLKYIENPLPPLPTQPRSLQKQSPSSTGKLPKPTKRSTYHHESTVIAPASPSIPLPPPPPPFTMPEPKFITKGHFVLISSANSSRCSSPGREDFDVMSVKSDGGDSIGPSFTCPSSDVDSKADTFISKLRDEWRLEKINSFKELQNTGSWSARLD